MSEVKRWKFNGWTGSFVSSEEFDKLTNDLDKITKAWHKTTDGFYIHRQEHKSQLAALREELARMTEGRNGLRLALDEANKIIAWQRDEKPDLARLADAERRNAAVNNLSDEALSVVVGMVEHCLNVRACMGMDEGYKDFLIEEDEHDFVLEIRAFVAALNPKPEAASHD